MKADKPIKVSLVGGGSGGHTSPLISLSQAIRRQQPNWRVSYIGVTTDKIAKKSLNTTLVDKINYVYGGKYRRYVRSEKLKGFQYLGLLKDFFLNARDFFLVIIGIFQSLIIYIWDRPTVVFSKGGYPAFGPCLAAVVLRIPLVVHDSDVIAGYVHRFFGRWAKLRLTGVPTDNGRYVGVPINPKFSQKLSGQDDQRLRQKYGLPPKAPLVLITGGSLGALRLNQAALAVIDRLNFKGSVHFVLVSGRLGFKQAQALAQEVSDSRLTILDFVEDMPDLLRACQIVVTRAGATALAEVSAAGKATIIVPNPLLPGSHQTHNAKAYAQKRAALLVSDSGQNVNLRALLDSLNKLLGQASLRQQLQKNIVELAVADADQQTFEALAEVIIATSPPEQKKRYSRHLNLSPNQQALDQLITSRRETKPSWQQQLVKKLAPPAAVIVFLALIAWRLFSVAGIEVRLQSQSALVEVSDLQAVTVSTQEFIETLSPLERLFIPDQDLQKYLVDRHGFINNVIVDKDVILARLELVVVPKDILGVLETPSKTTVISTDGYALTGYGVQSQAQAGLVITSSQELRATSSQELVLTLPELDFLKTLVAYLASKGERVVEVKVDIPDHPYEIRFLLANQEDNNRSFEIIMTLSADGLEQGIATAKALEFFDKEESYPQEYLDVRLITRVLYK